VPLRRAADGGPVTRGFLRVMGWSGRQWDVVAGGRLLLVLTGVSLPATAPLLHPDARAWLDLGALSGGMAALTVVSFVLPWSRLPRISTLGFPLAVWLALVWLSLGSHTIASAYLGLFVFCFAYVGLTQRAGTSLWLAPLAVAAYVEINSHGSNLVATRLIIAVPIWVGLAELLGELMSRQAVLTEQLRRAAYTDALTGLPNRRDLDLRLATARPGDAIVICDLDRFKRLNDTHGHAAGDEVLAEFGRALANSLRQGDYAARYGGEEFALLLPSTSEAQTLAALRRLRANWATLRPDITFSTGYAICRDPRTVTTTLAAADEALYAAKAGGRNRDREEILPIQP
jgi:diguanylate cyclase (GGDEF)-like protein